MYGVNTFLTLFILITVISRHLRLDKGTETGIMATIHGMVWSILDETIDADSTVHFGLLQIIKLVCYN